MGGLYRLFTKILPIMMLICFISFGIIHTFQQNPQNNLTYLKQESYNIGTEEEPEFKTMYKYDFIDYAKNIDKDILKRSVTYTFNIDGFTNTINAYNNIWKDGYQFLDVSKTILNSIILVVNAIIFPINITLIPLRITAGILLTGFSIIGINTNNGRVISPFLTAILDKANIPLLNSAVGVNDIEELETSKWTLKDPPTNAMYYDRVATGMVNGTMLYRYTDFDIQATFRTDVYLTATGYMRFKGIKTTYEIENNQRNFKIYYVQRGGQLLLIYDKNNGGYANYTDIEQLKNITFETENADSKEVTEMLYFLQANAIFITE